MPIEVWVCCAPAPRQASEQCLSVPEDSSVEAAVQASQYPQRLAPLDWRTLQPSVWGRPVPWTHRLSAGDRIELCRPLKVDPKVARRERFARQGVGRPGLFARKRPGAKPGY